MRQKKNFWEGGVTFRKTSNYFWWGLASSSAQGRGRIAPMGCKEWLESGLTPSQGEKVLCSESCVPSALFIEILISLILDLKNLIAVLLYSCLKQACVIYMGKKCKRTLLEMTIFYEVAMHYHVLHER